MKKEYNTEKKKLITAFLREHSERHFTVEEIADALASHGIAASTVYRNVAKLHEAGEVRRFETEGCDSFVYQYADLKQTCDSHYHLKCTKCGRLIHMECSKMDAVRDHIISEHDFIIGYGRSVIYGECASCAAKDKP